MPEALSVEFVFAVPGGAALPILDVLARHPCPTAMTFESADEAVQVIAKEGSRR